MDNQNGIPVILISKWPKRVAGYVGVEKGWEKNFRGKLIKIHPHLKNTFLFHRMSVCVCVWLCLCMCTLMLENSRSLNLLPLDLQVLVSCTTWMLGTELCSSTKTVCDLTCWDAFPAPCSSFLCQYFVFKN